MKIPLKKRIKDHNIFSGIGRKFLFYFIFFSIIPIILISFIGFKLTEKIVINQNIKYLDLQNEILIHRLEILLTDALDEISTINLTLDASYENILREKNSNKFKNLYSSPELDSCLNEISTNSTIFDSLLLGYYSNQKFQSPNSISFKLPNFIQDNTIDSSRQIQLIRMTKKHPPVLAIVDILKSTSLDSIDRLLFGIIDNKIMADLFRLKENQVQGNQIYLVDKISQMFYFPDETINEEIKANTIFFQNSGFFKRWDGKNVLRRIANLRFENLFIVADVTFQNAMNDIIVFRYQAIFGVGGLLILLIGLAFYFSQKITVPIRQLVYSAQDIGDGLLDAPIRINTNDEIGILAKELEQMRLNLLDYYENLEKKVNARTNELKKVQFQIAHQEKMASIGLLAAGIAHEIGNPLTSISSITQLLNRRLKDEKNLDYLSTIMNNINRISNIVRELVDFSRPSNFETNLTNINEVVRAAVGIVKYDSRSKHIKFELNLQPELPRLLLVGDQLLQVFINILFNAVDAMEDFGDTLIVETALKEHFIWILIKDSGRGISEDDINKIFEPFYTTKEVGKGTGLGLSVSYGIVKNFHGTIDVESEVGKGSAFRIKLPIRIENKE